MGWLDIIPLLQKVLPLLARSIPMLEVFVASRGVAKEEFQSTLNNFAVQVRDEIAATASHNGELTDAIAANTERIGLLSADVTRLRSTTEAQAAQIAATEQKITAMAAKLRLLLVLVAVLLVLSIALLVLLLVHRV